MQHEEPGRWAEMPCARQCLRESGMLDECVGRQTTDDRRQTGLCKERPLLGSGGRAVGPPSSRWRGRIPGKLELVFILYPRYNVRYMSKRGKSLFRPEPIEAKDWRLASSSLQADLSAARTWCGGRGSFWLDVLPKEGTHMASGRWPYDGGRRGQGPVDGDGENGGERTTRGAEKEARFNNRTKFFANCERTG